MKQLNKTKQNSQNKKESQDETPIVPSETSNIINSNKPSIPPEIGEIVENLPDDEKEMVVKYLHQEIFSGPIPHPVLLAKYEQISSGLADRIVTMAEKDQQHNIEIRSRTIDLQGRDSLLGSVFAFSTIILALASGTFLIYTGNEVGGFVALISAVCAGAKVFFGRDDNSKKEEKDNKSNS